jgi:peptidoglycan/xylan/chitin deacetylase (PgdA/CDA1 family)
MPTTAEILEIAAAVAGLAAGGVAYASVWPTSRLFGSTLSAPPNPASGPKQFAFTFDDGPNPLWTPPLLEILAKHNIRATFFLIGMYAAKQRALAREIHDAGHLIGNHTWTHPNLFRTSRADTLRELTDTSSELEQITGARVRFFRPPFGLRRPATLTIARSLGLIPVTWNVIGNDWLDKPTEYITQRVAGLTSGNDRRGNATNLVLHDGSHRSLDMDRSRSVAAASQLIDMFAPTHQFVTLDDWEPTI